MAGVLFADWSCTCPRRLDLSDQDLLRHPVHVIALHLRFHSEIGLSLIAMPRGFCPKNHSRGSSRRCCFFDWIWIGTYRIVRHATVYAALIAAWERFTPPFGFLYRGIRSGATDTLARASGAVADPRSPLPDVVSQRSAFWPVPEWPLYVWSSHRCVPPRTSLFARLIPRSRTAACVRPISEAICLARRGASGGTTHPDFGHDPRWLPTMRFPCGWFQHGGRGRPRLPSAPNQLPSLDLLTLGIWSRGE